MKKLLIGLLALGLVFSFSLPVMATDFSISGQYRVRGWLDSNSPLVKDDGASDAYYDQRLRIQPMFQVVEGLKVITRLDVMEAKWGSDVLRPGSDPYSGANSVENVRFDKAYVTFMTPYGMVNAGVNSTDVWGTDFGNTEAFVGEIDFLTKASEDLALFIRVEKDVEDDSGDNTIQDQDKDAYILAGVYKKEGIEAGMLYKYVRDAQGGLSTMGLVSGEVLKTIHVLSPYVKATVGPAYVEGQIYYGTGDVETDYGYPDIDLKDLLIYLMAKADVGPGYVGGMFAYSQGDDDPGDLDAKGAIFNGSDWNPCHILFNDTEPTTVGRAGGATTGAQLQNAYLYQIFAGMSPMEKLDVVASFTYAYADEKGDYVDDDIGAEIDLTASYKIYDNLDYTVGFGYLFAGDYYKGDDKDFPIDDTYLLMNKLQVNF